MKSTKTNTVHLTRDEMTALRAIAKAFGLMLPKGPGAGELGNVRALIACLASAYYRDNTTTIRRLAPLILSQQESNNPASALATEGAGYMLDMQSKELTGEV
jgi:hypothetical protein